jgi:hypothetical protein
MAGRAESRAGSWDQTAALFVVLSFIAGETPH